MPPPHATPDPFDAIVGGDHHARLRATERIEAAWRAPEQRPALTRALLDRLRSTTAPTALSAFAQLAGRLGAVEARPIVARLAASPRAAGRVRKSAATALGWIAPDPASVAAVASLARHDHPMYRRAAIEALGRMETADASDHLTRALNDPEWRVRQAASIGLGWAASPAAARTHCEALVGRLGDEGDARVLAPMLRSVAELGCRATELEEACAQRLVRVLEQTDRSWPTAARRAAARGIGELGGVRWRGVLERALEGEVAAVANEAAWGLWVMTRR